ncbi:porin [Sulfuricurvum sp.]|uniref:porin n=1 Tax=Sulfuricurvum sp. TaxID=2025608 RepID=UPI002E35177F|nr:porin [Sulfuricurvum sp.]HEX5329872.1 porin [Sulfuricurvum sp.]
MKLGKLSLVAVMALGTSAFAIDNVKVNGQAKFIYQTTDQQDGVKTGFFEQGVDSPTPTQEAARAGFSLTLGVTADLTSGVSAGAEMQAFSTLGAENNLVNGVMATGQVDDASAASQAWLATTLGKTTVKIGRMELDTPLTFTEKWNVVKNTFDAAVMLNNDLPDTTLVGAWVGKHNGMGVGTTPANGHTAPLLITSTGQTADLTNSPYATFGSKGAYALGAVNKSVPNTTMQGWYYNVVDVAKAYWLQADTKVMNMVTLGGQYANMDPDNKFGALKDSKIWAVKAGVDVSGVNVYAAYSSADKDGTLGFANVSTGDKTMIYTGLDSIYMDGIVTAPDTEAVKVGASTVVEGVKLAASYTDCDRDAVNSGITGWDVSASGKAGPVNLQAIYTSIDPDTASGFYANKDRNTIRLIATLPF